jgi:hypothetical protein
MNMAFEILCDKSHAALRRGVRIGTRRRQKGRIMHAPPSLLAFSSPLLLRGLSILSDYLDKAAAQAAQDGTGPAALLDARLAPDMLPLSGQVQMASGKAKNGLARLTGVTAPVFEDTETSFEELKARIDRTTAFIEAIPPGAFVGAADREIELRFGGATRRMDGQAYLTKFLLPDFYFHLATAHGILRHNGLGIGKADYLGTS